MMTLRMFEFGLVFVDGVVVRGRHLEPLKGIFYV